jgi:hypothetical protein
MAAVQIIIQRNGNTLRGKLVVYPYPVRQTENIRPVPGGTHMQHTLQGFVNMVHKFDIHRGLGDIAPKVIGIVQVHFLFGGFAAPYITAFTVRHLNVPVVEIYGKGQILIFHQYHHAAVIQARQFLVAVHRTRRIAYDITRLGTAHPPPGNNKTYAKHSQHNQRENTPKAKLRHPIPFAVFPVLPIHNRLPPAKIQTGNWPTGR